MAKPQPEYSEMTFERDEQHEMLVGKRDILPEFVDESFNNSVMMQEQRRFGKRRSAVSSQI